MKIQTYALISYVCYLISYGVIVFLSIEKDGPELSNQAYTDVVVFTIGPIVIATIIGGLLHAIKKSGVSRAIYQGLLFVSVLGIPINSFAAYLLWWSANNA